MTDRLIARYGALARRVHDALDELDALHTLDVPGAELDRLLDDAVYRLGLYESAMPGARLAGLPSLLGLLERETAALGIDDLPGDDLPDDDLPDDDPGDDGNADDEDARDGNADDVQAGESLAIDTDCPDRDDGIGA